MASSMALPGASTSSSSTHPWTYHVFLSFRGEDTRNNFTAHLYDALDRGGINTYIDNDLKRGEEISPALLKAIEGSRISIIIFSENYAESRWCLDELTKIVECKKTRQQTILPVFYHVDPSDVRNQRKSFGDALAKLEDRFKDDKDKVQRWKAALTEVANLSGHHLSNGNEAEFIYKIVQDVSRIVNITHLHVTERPVGIDTRVQDINAHLCVGMKDVRIVGIFGSGGIGKSTIAKAIYNSIAHEFTGSCFLANVRERSNGEGNLVQLQEELLFEILGNSKSLKVRNVDKGMILIKDRLFSKRVLLILDDVDQLDHLERLAGGRDWFGSGSRIIITTRDQRLLSSLEVDSMYEMKALDHKEALQLFSWHAFKRDKPIADYGELTEDIIQYAGGLPLALKVLGSDLKHRSIDEWRSALNEFKKAPHDTIQKILRISYDGLGKNEKDIFLDIACFFKGGMRNYIGEMLDGCGFSSVIGIKKLVEKCLISIDEDQRVVMHDLVQDMGKEVVRRESPKEPERRSRLWFHEDVRYVLEENMGTKKIEGILLDLPEGSDLICLHPKAFTKMKRLRVFINHNARFSGGPKFLSNELRVLDWAHYPLQSLPSNFSGNKLVVFRMHNNPFKEMGGGRFQNMTIIDFSGSKFLTKIPDLSRSPNLKEVVLKSCTNLVEVHHSVGLLDKLVTLNCWDCFKLTSFPKSLKLMSLENLYLQGCESLQNFPEIECEMKNVNYLLLGGSGIKELPPSIGHLTQLWSLDLGGCKNLACLPIGIFQLQGLESLILSGCPKLGMFGKDVENNGQSTTSTMSTLEYEMSSLPDLSTLRPPMNSSTFHDDSSPIAFPSLVSLDLHCCALSKTDLFTIFNCSSTLSGLDLSGSDIIRLPPSIVRFVGLTDLYLKDCKQLREIPELPPKIKVILASGCTSLERFLQLSKVWQFNTSDLQELQWVDLTGSHNIVVDVENSVPKSLLFQGYTTGHDSVDQDSTFSVIFPGSTIPNWFHHCEEDSDDNSFEIDISALTNLDKISGIALYIVIGSICGIHVENDGQPGIHVQYGGKYLEDYDIFEMTDLKDLDHVWLKYIGTHHIENNNGRVRVHNQTNSMIIKSCGFYLVYKHDKVKDDPDVLHGDVDVNLDVLEKEWGNSVHLMDGVQFSKRWRDDDDDHKLESHWHPKRKRHSSPFGMQISDLDYGDDDPGEEVDLELLHNGESQD